MSTFAWYHLAAGARQEGGAEKDFGQTFLTCGAALWRPADTTAYE